MFVRVITETLNVRSQPGSGAGSMILAVLKRGAKVEAKGPASGSPRWLQIMHEGKEGFVFRRHVAQAPGKPLQTIEPDMDVLVTGTIASITARYDSITYRLGCKCKAQGLDALQFSGTDVAGAACTGSTVDCSGWVAGLFQLIAANINKAKGREVFTTRETNRLITHSDGQIVNVGSRAGQIWSGTDIDALPLRSGLLFGLNNGDYDWEGSDRTFGIDHIVMGVKTAQGYAITQSSSSGGGVNLVPWDKWRAQNDGRFQDFAVHCADLLAMGSWTPPAAGVHPEAMEGARDPLTAPAG